MTAKRGMSTKLARTADEAGQLTDKAMKKGKGDPNASTRSPRANDPKPSDTVPPSSCICTNCYRNMNTFWTSTVCRLQCRVPCLPYSSKVIIHPVFKASIPGIHTQLTAYCY